MKYADEYRMTTSSSSNSSSSSRRRRSRRKCESEQRSAPVDLNC